MDGTSQRARTRKIRWNALLVFADPKRRRAWVPRHVVGDGAQRRWVVAKTKPFAIKRPAPGGLT